jgi:hypothetical protein
MTNPYLNDGRLGYVVAAIQVMSAGERPEATIESWAKRLSGSKDEPTISSWKNVFEEHPEFFLIYDHPNGKKAALRWRYALKTWDAKTDKTHLLEQIPTLAPEIRDRLTSKPLMGDQIQTLLNTAIALNTDALQKQTASKWWIPLLASVLAFAGAILGNLLSPLLGLKK